MCNPLNAENERTCKQRLQLGHDLMQIVSTSTMTTLIFCFSKLDYKMIAVQSYKQVFVCVGHFYYFLAKEII